jgi:beta-galactosidase
MKRKPRSLVEASKLWLLLLALVSAGPGALGRDRISLDSNWRFRLGDPPDVTTNVAYYPEISDLSKLPTDLTGTNSETYMETIRVDIFGTHAGENVSFVQPGYNDSGWRQLNVPHDWAVELPFDSSADGSHGYKPLGKSSYTTNNVGWYRRAFTLPANYSGQSLWLQFDGVYRNCLVWLNGHIVGRNVSGYVSFCFDVTAYANPGGTNVLVVRVDANRYEGWFYEGAGIYRHVWLTAMEPVHVAQWGTYAATTSLAGSNATVRILTDVTNQSAFATTNASLTSVILDPSSNTVATITSLLNLSASQALTVTQTVSFVANLWSPQTPYLYRMVSTISNQNSAGDAYSTTFGVRTISIDPANGLFLNGQRTFVQGMSLHQDAAGVGSALPDRLAYYRIERLKQMGANGYRTAHNAPAPEILDACDQLGMLVLDENRRFGTNAEPLSQLSRLIRRDRNHPSVFAWSLCNEETAWQGTPGGATLIQVMQNLVHSLDPWRKCTAACNYGWNSGFATVLDMEGLNYEKFGNVDCLHRDLPNLPVVGTETGSTTTTRGQYYINQSATWVPEYDVVYSSITGAGNNNWGQPCETWLSRYASRQWICGGFHWTGFAYRGEETPYGWPSVSSHFGVMDLCGFPKDVFYYFQANWTVKPVLHVLPHWNWGTGTNVNIWAFGNCDSVELFTNNISLGRKLLNPQNHLEWNVPWSSGTLKAVGYTRGVATLTNSWTTTAAPSTIALVPDRSTILADGQDLSVVTVAALDGQGNIMPTATNTVSFTVSGGAIIGVANGNPASHDADKGTQIPLFNGLAQVLVQSTNVPGSLILTATSSGLPTANATIIESATSSPPAAPGNVVAVPGNASVTVGWDIVPGATTYNLWRATVSGGPYSLVIGNIGAAGLGYTDTGVANNTTYYYVVTANGSGTNSTNSVEVSAKPVPIVSNLAVVATNAAIQMKWTGPPGAIYNVKRSITCGGPYTTIGSSVAATNYSDTAVNAGQSYYYIVTITNGSGESIPSNEEGAWVSNLPSPWTSVDVGQVDWAGSASYNTNNAQYTITGAGRGTPDPNVTSFDSFQFVYVYVPNSSSGVSVQARVANVQNVSGNSRAGVMLRENLYADAQYAAADIQATAGLEFNRRNGQQNGAATTTLNGTAPQWVRLARTNNTFYAWSSANGSNWTAIGSPSTFTSMNSGAYMGFFVSSRDNGFLASAAVDNVTGTSLPATATPPPPAAPATLTATLNGQVQLNWTSSSGAAGYNVKRAFVSGGPYTTLAPWIYGTNFTDTANYTSTPYYYVVTAVNSGGESPNSPEATVTTPTTLTMEPTDDSYVEDGTSATSNFGTSVNLKVKNQGPNTSFTRVTYLKFNVQPLATAQSVKLLLTPYQVDGSGVTNAFELVTNDNWSESTIIWNNQPGGSGIIITNMRAASYTVGSSVMVDVTSWALSQATNDGNLSLRITDPKTNAIFVGFWSKEAPTTSYHPVLQFANPGNNTPPTLAAISNRTIGAGVTLTITNSATDSDVPVQTLTFGLPTAPTNAVISSNSGVLAWRPFVSQANTTNPFMVMVADSGTPTKVATQSFAVTVSPLISPAISNVSLSAGQLVLQVNGANGPDYQIQSSTNLINWSAAFTTNSPAMPFVWTNSMTGPPIDFFRVLVGPPLP